MDRHRVRARPHLTGSDAGNAQAPARENGIGRWKWIILALLVGAAVLALWGWPKTQAFEFGPDITGYYRGLGLDERDVFFIGKSYFAVKLPSGDHGYCIVSFDRPGYNHFKGYYHDGKLREEGTCFVELMGGYDRPAPYTYNVQDGRYSKPEGDLGSEIKNGTGVQTYWTPNGTKVWELEFRDFKRAHLSWWHPNGQLFTTLKYVDGKQDGRSVSYYPSGQKRSETEYSADERVGKWIRYLEDGNVESVEDYTASPEQAPRAGEFEAPE